MPDATDIIPVIVRLLHDTSTIYGYVDGQIIAGLIHDQADAYLGESHKTCIGVRKLSENVSSFIGSGSSGEYRADILCDIFVLSRKSAAYASDVARAIRNLMLQQTSISYGGSSYPLAIWGTGRKPLYDQDGAWWQETITFRLYNVVFNASS
jgi:hypothetical protein